MKIDKLIPMVDFVLKTVHSPNKNEIPCLEQDQKRLEIIYKYTRFLKQPLKLEMFVSWKFQKTENENSGNGKRLFEGFRLFDDVKDYYELEIDNGDLESLQIFSLAKNSDETIENLLENDMDFILTENALKQIYG